MTWGRLCARIWSRNPTPPFFHFLHGAVQAPQLTLAPSAALPGSPSPRQQLIAPQPPSHGCALWHRVTFELGGGGGAWMQGRAGRRPVHLHLPKTTPVPPYCPLPFAPFSTHHTQRSCENVTAGHPLCSHGNGRMWGGLACGLAAQPGRLRFLSGNLHGAAWGLARAQPPGTQTPQPQPSQEEHSAPRESHCDISAPRESHCDISVLKDLRDGFRIRFPCSPPDLTFLRHEHRTSLWLLRDP